MAHPTNLPMAPLPPWYVYHDLPQSGRYIRLLRITPPPHQDAVHSQTTPCDVPSCQVYTFKLKSAPPYLALSYVWGTSKGGKSDILLDNKRWKVTNTLYHFLRIFRHDTENCGGEIYLWIVSL
jgi:hypothetical protein